MNIKQDKNLKVLVISDYRLTLSVRPEAELFIGLHKEGVQVDIMTYPEAEYVSRFAAEGIKVFPFHPDKKFDKSAVSFIRKRLVEGGYQFLHLFNSKAIINGLKAAKGLSVKTVLYRGFTGNVHWYDPTAYLKYLNPGVDYIHCNSESVAESLNKNLLFGKAETIVIPKGHHPDWYNNVKKVDLNLQGIPKDAFTVVFNANVRRMKGIPYLLKAIAKIPESMPVHWLLIGSGMDTPAIKKRISQNPNSDKIHMTGYLENVLDYVAACDVCVLPSLYGESNTKAIIEAMSLGVIPLITNISGNRNLVENNVSGLVAPVKNPEAIAEGVLKLYANAGLRKELAKGAIDRIKNHFHVQGTIQKMLEFYKSNTSRSLE